MSFPNLGRSARRLLLLSGLALAAPLAAHSAVLDQVWIGGFAHDISDWGAGKESNTADILLEVDTGRPSLLRAIGAPRLNLILAVNSAGRTNSASAGLTWDHRLFGDLYGSIDLGMGVTDGVATPPAGPAGVEVARTRLLLGSKVLFREAVGVDWRMNDRWALGVEFVHMSNGQILAHNYNDGINDAGVRLGYRF